MLRITTIRTVLSLGWALSVSTSCQSADICNNVNSAISRNYNQKDLTRLAINSSGVIIGDSIAARWPSKSLRQLLGRDFLNLGVPQDEPGNVLWRLSLINTTRKWKRVLLVLGVNSAWKFQKCDVASGIEIVVDRIHALAPEARIVTLAILPYQEGMTSTLRSINSINDKLNKDKVERHYLFVDAGAPFLKTCQDKPQCPLLEDWLHPTEKGYEVITSKIMESSPW